MEAVGQASPSNASRAREKPPSRRSQNSPNIPNHVASASSTSLASDRSRRYSKNSQEGLKLPRSSDGSLASSSKTQSSESIIMAAAKKNEELLSSLKSDMESIRSIASCKICARLLYEPYIISCGHTFCYSCLCTWFSNNKHNKTCPDCRAAVHEMPAPAYLLKELITVMISRTELLPSSEKDEHERWQKEEAEAVQKDKNNTNPQHGGLFKGAFKRRFGTDAYHDDEDNVDRCPACHHEVVQGMCSHCDWNDWDIETGDSDSAVFRDVWGGSLRGFSDDDARTDDVDADDLDHDLDMTDNDLDSDIIAVMAHEHLASAEFGDYDGNNYIQQWMNRRGGPPSPQGIRRMRPLAAHSAAGSRRRSNTASLMSDEIDMDTVEEEDEDEDEDEEDSSMADFLDDDNIELASQTSSSTGASGTPQPEQRPNHPRRAIVIVSDSPEPRGPSTSRSTSLDEESDEDDEDESPISHIRRRQTRVQARLNRNRNVPSSNMDPENHLFHQALRNRGWSPLDQGASAGVEEGGGEYDEDSDGGRTTVGLETNTNHALRNRNSGSLTPTADTYNAASTSSPRPRTTRFPDGSRGLRRRSSVLSVSSINYEGEADDDDSDIDRDGDSTMGDVRRASNARLGASISRPSVGVQQVLGDGLDGVSDGSSDESIARHQGRRRTRQRRDYDPRISFMFAEHQNFERNVSMEREDDVFAQLELLRGSTPIHRPGTSNRNRRNAANTMNGHTNSAYAQHPAYPVEQASPDRRRTPGIGRRASNNRLMAAAAQTDGFTPSFVPASSAHLGNSGNGIYIDGRGSVDPDPRDSRPNIRAASNPIASGATIPDAIVRPMSRQNSRPPSATGRRPTAPVNAPYQSPFMGPGLNFAARSVQQSLNSAVRTMQQSHNPFAPRLQTNVRPRQSSQRLREQTSTATIRPRTSTRTMRTPPSQSSMRDHDTASGPDRSRTPRASVAPSSSSQHSPSSARPQASRANLRPQPSQARLMPQPSTRLLRAAVDQVTNMPPITPLNGVLDDAERRRRASELVRRRERELLQGSTPRRVHGSDAISVSSGPSSARSSAAPLGTAFNPITFSNAASSANIARQRAVSGPAAPFVPPRRTERPQAATGEGSTHTNAGIQGLRPRSGVGLPGVAENFGQQLARENVASTAARGERSR
ncbi:hypothetical protein P152DRAFT_455193 [Eremomyces bilateralis CBS 781.70]|uniref:RING-type domain-containing protein n=1 Tax=Eremomyces bilateralis CBS 781.70 TaxID=1392243 RepID=A0A6G1GC54_9PEZI|nr:uncharacterized protein P152DRAFT_455193 [Eremomyces bilateralis CBS 781.70]KAF1815480.1 hypothetical protein P152DRAFT_455193 [Eremomyces bilateralis CBS 781.70]